MCPRGRHRHAATWGDFGVNCAVMSPGPEFELSRVPIPTHLVRFIDSWLGYREISATAVERMEHPSGRGVLIFEYGRRALRLWHPHSGRGSIVLVRFHLWSIVQSSSSTRDTDPCASRA